MKNQNKKSLVITIVLIVITAFFIFKYTDFKALQAINEQTHKGYLTLSLVALFFFWLCDARIFKQFSKMTGVPISLSRAFLYTMVGIYYSLITPFSSGGQPAQMFYMSKNQHTLGSAGSCVLSKFIVYQITVGIYAVLMFLIKAQDILLHVGNLIYYILFGLIINIISILLLIAVAYNAKLIETIVKWIVCLLQRVNLAKSYNDKKIKHDLQAFKKGLHSLWQHKAHTLYAGVMTIIQLTSYFSITYFIYRALGYQNKSLATILALQAMLYMAISFIPTPGTIGAAEGGFYLLFSMCLPKDQLFYAMLFWRTVTFYFSLIVSGLFSLGVHLNYLKHALWKD